VQSRQHSDNTGLSSAKEESLYQRNPLDRDARTVVQGSRLMAVNEITEAVLKSRILAALTPNFKCATGSMTGQLNVAVNEFYEAGGFAEFVGTVHRTKSAERLRAAGICRRLGHRVTAAQILKG